MLVGLLGYAAVYLVFARKLGYSFRPVYFIIYYVIYSPLWLAAMIWGLVTVFVRKETVDIDWKV